MRTILTGVLGLFVAMTVAHGDARADGGVFIEDVGELTQAEAVQNGLVDSDGQRAAFVRFGAGQCWQLYIEPGTMKAGGAAWILPLPVAPTGIDEASERFLDELDAATLPIIETRVHYEVMHYSDSSGCLFGGGGGDGGSAEAVGEGSEATQADGAVYRWGAGRLGALDWTVLSGDSADAVAGWLARNGYVVPDELGARIAPYVAEGWRFLATRFARDAEAATTLPTLRLELCDLEEPVYPMRLTTLSMRETLDVTLWVATAGDPPSVAEFETVPDDDLAWENEWRRQHREPPRSTPSYSYRYGDEEPTQSDAYAAVLDSLLDQGHMVIQFSGSLDEAAATKRVETLGGDAAFPLSAVPEERSLPLQRIMTPGLHVTRWRGRFRAAAMDEDIVFRPPATALPTVTGVYEREAWQEISEDQAEELGLALSAPLVRPGLAGALLVALLALGLALRPRRPAGR